MDKEILKIARFCTDKCRQILNEKRELVSSLAERLVVKESLDLKDIVEILGERPYPPRDNFKSYLESKAKDVVEEGNDDINKPLEEVVKEDLKP